MPTAVGSLFGGYTPGYAGTPSWVGGASLYRSMNFLNALVGGNAGGLGPSFLAGALEWAYRGGMLGVNPNDQMQFGSGQAYYAGRAAQSTSPFWRDYYSGEASAYGAMNAIAPAEAAWFGTQASTYFWNNQTLGATVRLYGWIGASAAQGLAIGGASSQYMRGMYQQNPNLTEQMLLGNSYLAMAYGYQDPMQAFYSNTLQWGLGYGMGAQLRYGGLNPMAMAGITLTLGGFSMLADTGVTMLNRYQAGLPIIPSGQGGERFSGNVLGGIGQAALGMGLNMYYGRGISGLGGAYGQAINSGVDYAARGTGILGGLAAWAGLEALRPYGVQGIQQLTGLGPGPAQGAYSIAEVPGVMAAQYGFSRLGAYASQYVPESLQTVLGVAGGLVSAVGIGLGFGMVTQTAFELLNQYSLLTSPGYRSAITQIAQNIQSGGEIPYWARINPGFYTSTAAQINAAGAATGTPTGTDDFNLNRRLLQLTLLTGRNIPSYFRDVYSPGGQPFTSVEGQTGFLGDTANVSGLSRRAMYLAGLGPATAGVSPPAGYGRFDLTYQQIDTFRYAQASGGGGVAGGIPAYLGPAGYSTYQKWVQANKPGPSEKTGVAPAGMDRDPVTGEYKIQDYESGPFAHHAGPHSTKELAPTPPSRSTQPSTQTVVYRVVRDLIEKRVLIGSNLDYLTRTSYVNQLWVPLSSKFFDEGSK